jgi:hypothetical protein
MTEEYKDVLLKYLTGNIKEGEVPQELSGHFEEPQVVTNGLDTYLSTELGLYTIMGILQSENYDKYILYGTRRLNGTNYGFLLVTDQDYNPINLITEYNSGTYLQDFYQLEVDEKNQIYGIDYNNETSKTRFIMLNNVFANSEAKLRQSYNLPTQIASMQYYQVTKDANSANYLIAGIVFKGNIDQPLVAKLTVNVGSENEWVYYNYSGTLLGAESALSNIYATWDNDQPEFKITAFSESQFLVYSSWYNNDDTLISVELYDIGGDWTSETIYNATSVVADIDTCYYGVHATAFGQEQLVLYMIDNGVQQFISAYNLEGRESDTLVKYDLRIKNGALFYMQTVPSGSGYKFLGGVYRNNVINETTVIADNVQVVTYPIFGVINNFNLYKFNCQVDDNLYSLKLLYNANISFGSQTTGYNNYQDLKPLTMSLYENDDILFNRNLYNLVTSGSTTTATVEVPNTMLNSDTIDGENLLGNHYLQIANNTEEITTNEYETLHINSINTLSMINQDTGALNLSGAIRLNNSTNIAQDYENAQVSKIRINYADGTNLVRNIEKPILNNGIYTYTFVVYVPKTIVNIEIISNDEKTTYQTITGTFETEKYYKITQEVTI